MKKGDKFYVWDDPSGYLIGDETIQGIQEQVDDGIEAEGRPLDEVRGTFVYEVKITKVYELEISASLKATEKK